MAKITPRQIKKLDSRFDDLVTGWIQDYKNYPDEALKEKIIEKTKIIAKYRNDNSLVEMIKQRLGD